MSPNAGAEDGCKAVILSELAFEWAKSVEPSWR